MFKDSWIEFDQKTYKKIWDKFEEKFDFHPSVSKFPAIKEPKGSITYSLLDFQKSKNVLEKEEAEIVMNQKILQAFKNISHSGKIFAIDWQHPSYFLDTASLGIEEYNQHLKSLDGKFIISKKQADYYMIPIIPDGDYSIFLTQDFENGIFGHPWEPSICIFGKELLQQIQTGLPKLLSHILRQN